MTIQKLRIWLALLWTSELGKKKKNSCLGFRINVLFTIILKYTYIHTYTYYFF